MWHCTIVKTNFPKLILHCEKPKTISSCFIMTKVIDQTHAFGDTPVCARNSVRRLGHRRQLQIHSGFSRPPVPPAPTTEVLGQRRP